MSIRSALTLLYFFTQQEKLTKLNYKYSNEIHKILLLNLFFFRMNVSKMCGPFRGHVYMFHVLRGDILKLQEVSLKNSTSSAIFFTKHNFISESLFVAVNHVPCSTSSNWIAFADVMVIECSKCWIFSPPLRLKIDNYPLNFIIIPCYFSVLVYYLRSKSKARIEMVKLLKEMLYIEAKDKEFLLANITRITQNNGIYYFTIQSPGVSV